MLPLICANRKQMFPQAAYLQKKRKWEKERNCPTDSHKRQQSHVWVVSEWKQLLQDFPHPHICEINTHKVTLIPNAALISPQCPEDVRWQMFSMNILTLLLRCLCLPLLLPDSEEESKQRSFHSLLTVVTEGDRERCRRQGKEGRLRLCLPLW